MTIKPKQIRCKKCANCKGSFNPSRSFQSWCSPECAVVIARLKQAKQKAQEAANERVQHAKAKEAVKTRAQHLKEAQAAWNRYVRARDYGLPCASCGAMPAQKIGGTMDCSHYRSVGSSPHMRFNLHNAAAACVRCNRHLSGNVVELRRGLVARIGEDKVLAVEADQSVKKFTIDYLVRLKKIFGRKAVRIEKRRKEDSQWIET